MSTQTNKTIALRYFAEIWNQRNLAAIDDVLAADIIGHVGSLQVQGRDALRQRVETLHQIYREPHFHLDEPIAERDKVVIRWTLTGLHTGEFMGATPSGRAITVTGTNIFRLFNDQIVEVWVNSDDLGELQQLGVLASLPPV
jgi:steroid delta-isomerase-like uncharacterized protein